MMNKWMMNWWMDDGFILNGIFQWEKFLNVCVFQWHFWLIFLVEIHSMCVFSMENHSMGKSMENHSMGIFNDGFAFNGKNCKRQFSMEIHSLCFG